MPFVLHMILTLWPFASLEGADFDGAAEYSRRHGGRALLVVVGDAVVFEQWHNGAREGFKQTVFSGTKAFGCALAGLVVGDRLMALDERVTDTFPALEERETSATMTVRSLLTQTSGMKGGGTSTRGNHLEWIRGHARQLTGTKAGARFTYGAAHWDLLAAIVKEKVGEDAMVYLEKRLMAPAGMTIVDWKTDDAGQRFLAFGLVTTPRSWARYGMLLRDGGVIEGRRLLPAEVVKECWRGSEANPAYGFGLWLNQPMPKEVRRKAGLPTTLRALKGDGKTRAILPGGPGDLAMAAGSADTRLYIIPSRKMVIVRFGTTDHPRFSDAKMLRPILMPATMRR